MHITSKDELRLILLTQQCQLEVYAYLSGLYHYIIYEQEQPCEPPGLC